AGEHDYEKSRLRIGDSNGGYRRVWPRDLYHKGIAFLAVKDNATAIDIARWFKKTQLRTSMLPGTWAQNMWADGTPSWQGFQIDQAAFPIVLISRLVQLRLVSYAEFRDMVQHAADSIITNGPATGQERWEENGGLSPNSFAAAIQGLLA